MTQTALIDKVLKTAGMEDCNPNQVPAQQETLGQDPEGEPFEESWGYSTVVGMLMYLSTNTRPVITFAVSQVARFNHSPKKSHGTAVKMILRYLKGTRDKGMIVKLRDDLKIDAYADADFAGLYRREPDTDPVSAKSRMGYIMFLAGCPVLWKSQLIQEICLSSTHSEYVTLSSCLRVVMPFQELLKEMARELGLPQALQATIRSTAFEDNSAALQLATEQRTTNRTRYFHVKWHWFWEHVKDGTVNIERVETSENRSDTCTKPLPKVTFQKLSKQILGW